jgi:hypothetical protein
VARRLPQRPTADAVAALPETAAYLLRSQALARSSSGSPVESLPQQASTGLTAVRRTGQAPLASIWAVAGIQVVENKEEKFGVAGRFEDTTCKEGRQSPGITRPRDADLTSAVPGPDQLWGGSLAQALINQRMAHCVDRETGHHAMPGLGLREAAK